MFATTRSDAQVRQSGADPWVALVIDSRDNRESDFHEAIAVTATGRSREALEPSATPLAARYLRQAPGPQEASSSRRRVRSSSSDVDTYYLVSRFQNVVELHVRP